jgi:4-carboxymuconolactone decarboxylase
MARISEPTRDELSPDARAVLDHIAKTRGGLRGPYGVMLHHPPLAERVAAVGEQIRFRSLLSGADRELAVLAAAREADAPYEWAAHEPIARREGVRPEAIAVVRERLPTDGLTARETVLVDTVRALYRRHRLDDAEYAQAEAELGQPELVELVTLAGYYGMIAFVLNAFEVSLPPEAAAAEVEAFNRYAGGAGAR